MSPDYDAIVIGAGHNGLVTAALLAKASLSVLVLERRHLTGGAAATEEIHPGFRYNTGAADAGLFREEIVEELNLGEHGLTFIDHPILAYAPQANGKALTIWRDPQRSKEEIASFSKRDAEAFPEYVSLVEKLSRVLGSMMLRIPPNPKKYAMSELLPWASTALQLRRLGNKDMIEFLRTLPMTAKEFLDDWFESPALKGLLGSPSVAGSLQGPQASGTALMMLYQQTRGASGGFKSIRFVRGGMGRISEALSDAAKTAGVELRCNAGVQEILLNNGRATGVNLSDGESIQTNLVVSSLDPRRTLFGLVGAPELTPSLMRRVRSIKYRGSTAKVNLALSDLPIFTSTPPSIEYLGGTIVISPSLDYLERAYDKAKYGHMPEHPCLEISIPSILDETMAPLGQHVMSITVRYAPYHLKNGSWGEQREALGDAVISTLANYIPDIRDLILHRQVITPLDWEEEYGLTEGSILHGQMGLDQLFFMRPVAGYAQYSAPIENLYLCGAGTHPGGGVTGAPGYNAARAILRNL